MPSPVALLEERSVAQRHSHGTAGESVQTIWSWLPLWELSAAEIESWSQIWKRGGHRRCASGPRASRAGEAEADGGGQTAGEQIYDTTPDQFVRTEMPKPS